MIPEWMKEAEGFKTVPAPSSRKRKNFVNKTLDGILSFFEETLTSEGFARRPGLLQGLDPRVKLISILTLVVVMTLVQDIRIMAAVYLITLVIAWLSKIEIIFFIKRVWLFIPLFTGVIALPLLFNVFMPGDIVFTLFTPGPGASIGPIALPETIGITSQGIMTAAMFTLRVATCVSTVVLLFLTTPQDALFKSLRSIGVPKIYVLTLDMCYRYIFLFMDIVKSLYTAKKSRTIKSMGTIAEQKWVGGRIGYTLIKTLDMSERVHQAMTSRGFTGDVKIMQRFKMKGRDYVALAATLLFSGTILLMTYFKDIRL